MRSILHPAARPSSTLALLPLVALLTLAACSGGGHDAAPDAGSLPMVDGGTGMTPMPMPMPPVDNTPIKTPDAGTQDAGGTDAGTDAGEDAGQDAGQDAGDPCVGVANACATAGEECEGDLLVVCEENGDGCLVETRTNCLTVGSNNSCDGALDPPACAYDECKDEFGVMKPDACVMDETTCAEDILIECVDDSDGCPLATPTNCKTVDPGNLNFCDDSLVPPACGLDPCIGVTNCLTAGLSCNGTDLVDCQPDGDGCLVQSVTDCTQGGTAMETCIPGVTPACAPCADDVGCPAADACDADVFERCVDTDGDMCLNLVAEDCGASFMCNMASGCVYDGGEVCDTAPTATLRAAGSFGPFMTTGGTSTYASYPCPGLLALFPFAAAGRDHLFAVDVAPQTVVTVTLSGTFTAAWMVLLTDCSGAGAEMSCQAMSKTSITHANDSTTTERVYLTIDADGAATTGTYGLDVDVRSLKCGDGFLDGDEACDDGNILANDGCAADCTLETGYKCTNANPSVCTLWPTDGVCGNVMCPELPMSAPSGGELCCTTDQLCGVGYPTYYGAGCFERDQAGPNDAACQDEVSTLFFYPTIQGCCRPDAKCGLLLSDAGMGCVERSEFWLYSQDGAAASLYSGPFNSIACTP